MLKRIQLVVLATAFAALVVPAQAEQVCGLEAKVDGNTTSVALDGLSASCQKDSICSVMLANGNDMQVAMERASIEGSWLIRFTGASSIDTGAGVDLVFNGNDETRIAPEFLIASEDMKEARVDDDVSQIMVSTMGEAKTMVSTVQFIGGKKVNLETNLSALGKALEWVDCAQAGK